MIDKTKKKMTILDVAQSLFARFGLSKTTIEDIAKKARMGKASIYYYFKNKESIFQEVISKEGHVVQEKIRKAVNAEELPQDKMRAYFLTRMLSLRSLANYYSALRDEYLDHYAFIEKERQSHDVFEITMVSNILQEGIQKAKFEIDDVTLTAETIVTALKGIEYQWPIQVAEEQIKNNVDALLKILFKGIEIRK